MREKKLEEEVKEAKRALLEIGRIAREHLILTAWEDINSALFVIDDTLKDLEERIKELEESQ